MKYLLKKTKPAFLLFLCVAIFNYPFLHAQTQMAPACDLPTGTSTSAPNIFGVPFGYVDNPEHAIDGDVSSHASFRLVSPVSLGSTWRLNANLGSKHTGDIYVDYGTAVNLLNVNFFNGVTVRGFDGSSQRWEISGSELFNWVIAIGAGATRAKGYLTPPNELPYDRIQISYTSGAGINIPFVSFFTLYEVRRVPYKPHVSILASSIDCGSKTLTASVSNILSDDLTYQWYKDGAAIPDATAATYTTPSLGSAADYSVIATVDMGCEFSPTVRRDTANIHFDECVLPVTFGPINATISGQELTVLWSTESEINNDHFVVEASFDGKKFTQIGNIVKSKAENGNSDKITSYTFSHSFGSIAYGAVIAVLLGMGAFAYKRKNKFGVFIIAVLAISSTVLYSCSKGDKEVNTTSSKDIWVRIAQYDKDNNAPTYSPVVKAIKK